MKEECKFPEGKERETSGHHGTRAPRGSSLSPGRTRKAGCGGVYGGSTGHVWGVRTDALTEIREIIRMLNTILRNLDRDGEVVKDFKQKHNICVLKTAKIKWKLEWKKGIQLKRLF